MPAQRGEKVGRQPVSRGRGGLPWGGVESVDGSDDQRRRTRSAHGLTGGGVVETEAVTVMSIVLSESVSSPSCENVLQMIL